MIIWVKELANVLTINSISTLFKKDVSIEPFYTFDGISLDDIIIISKKDSVTESDFVLYTTLIYENFIEKIYSNITEEFQYNYDYYYLKNALRQAKNPSINTIITGSSYGLFDIDSDLLTHEVNLSLASQDLYYSLKGIYEVCNTNKNIQNIVLCCGYYCFFSDLSKSQNSTQIMQISKIYQPLYNDIHNCTLLPPKADILFKSNIFDVQNLIDRYSMGEYEKHYFHPDRPRKKYATKEWDDKSKEWIELSDNEKEEAAKRRTALHNKNYKRKLTLIENTSLFNKLVSFCTNNKINLLLVVTPSSKYYVESLYSGYKTAFYDVLNSVEGVIHLLDLSENDPMYSDEDFNDTDHLNDLGATKMTTSILNTLQEITSKVLPPVNSNNYYKTIINGE